MVLKNPAAQGAQGFEKPQIRGGNGFEKLGEMGCLASENRHLRSRMSLVTVNIRPSKSSSSNSCARHPGATRTDEMQSSQLTPSAELETSKQGPK
jgi:hypothetical protein